MGRRLIAPLALLLTLATAGPAGALDWHTVQTLKHVRGVPDPQVAIDKAGRSTVVLSTTEDDLFGPRLDLFVRAPGSASRFAGPLGPRGRTEPAIAASPNGALGIASVDSGRLRVTVYPAPGPDPAAPNAGPAPATTLVDAAGTSVSNPQIVLASDGTATVAWASPPSLGSAGPSTKSVYAVEVSASGAAGPVAELATGGSCSPVLDGNLRGDAVVLSRCVDPSASRVHVKPAGSPFGPPQPIPAFELGPTDVTIDGAGTVLAVEAADRSQSLKAPEYRAYVAVRPPGGVFGERQTVPMPTSAFDLAVESQEDGRTVAAWRELGSLVYAYRLPGGRFAPAGTVDVPASAVAASLDLVVAPSGPALVWWRDNVYVGRDPQLVRLLAAVIDGQSGSVSGAPLSVPSPIGSLFAPSFAINEDGRAVAAWEQRCEGGGYAVMTAVRDDLGAEPRQGPCQDGRPPRVIAVHKRALLRRRYLRVRIACDEACRVTASARVLRAGVRKPLARAKTRGGERRLAARRGAWLRIRLTSKDAARVRRALGLRRRVTLRLSVSVRDAYGNGRRWRIAVPVRR